MPNMRAKVKITSIVQHETHEDMTMNPVYANSYPDDGVDENNSFARFTPSGEIKLTVNNPDLRGKFNAGDEYYVDFQKA